MKKERVRNWREGSRRKMTACDSETETERWGWGADWVFALWARLAKGKPAHSTMCHSTFYQQHSKLFLEDGSFTLSDLGSVFFFFFLFHVCVRVCLSRANGRTQWPTMLCWNTYVCVSQMALLTFLSIFQSSVCKSVACGYLCPAGVMLTSVCMRKKICCMSSSSHSLSVTP